jgi:hypothetical protein
MLCFVVYLNTNDSATLTLYVVGSWEKAFTDRKHCF